MAAAGQAYGLARAAPGINKINSRTPSTVYTTATATTVKCKIQLINGNRKTSVAH